MRSLNIFFQIVLASGMIPIIAEPSEIVSNNGEPERYSWNQDLKRGDPEKQILRKAHFLMLISAFESIASGSFSSQEIAIYDALPENKLRLHDLILRRMTYRFNKKDIILDVAFRHEEINTNLEIGFYKKHAISDIGDLDDEAGFEEIKSARFDIYPGEEI